MGNASFLILVIATSALALVGLVICFVYFLRRIFLNQSGLSKLVNSYPVENRPEGMVFEKQTVGLGRSVRFRKCARVCISRAGLYVAIKVIFGRRVALLIPWREFSIVTETRFYGLNALRLSVGEPEITSIRIYSALFSKIKPFLNEKGLMERPPA